MSDLLKCPCCNKELSPESGEVEDGQLTFTCDLCLTVISAEELNIITITSTMSAEVIGQALAEQIRREGGEVPDYMDPEQMAEEIKNFLKHIDQGEM